MQPIVFPLKQQMQGPDVAALHAVLTLLEFASAEKGFYQRIWGAD